MQVSVRRNHYAYAIGIEFWPGRVSPLGWALDLRLLFWTISFDGPDNPKGM